MRAQPVNLPGMAIFFVERFFAIKFQKKRMMCREVYSYLFSVEGGKQHGIPEPGCPKGPAPLSGDHLPPECCETRCIFIMLMVRGVLPVLAIGS